MPKVVVWWRRSAYLEQCILYILCVCGRKTFSLLPRSASQCACQVPTVQVGISWMQLQLLPPHWWFKLCSHWRGAWFRISPSIWVYFAVCGGFFLLLFLLFVCFSFVLFFDLHSAPKQNFEEICLCVCKLEIFHTDICFPMKQCCEFKGECML